MTNTFTDTKKTNTIGSKLEAFFKDNRVGEKFFCK